MTLLQETKLQSPNILFTPKNSKYLNRINEPYIETEEEAHERKSKLYDFALNTLTANCMVFSTLNFVPITF